MLGEGVDSEGGLRVVMVEVIVRGRGGVLQVLAAQTKGLLSANFRFTLRRLG